MNVIQFLEYLHEHSATTELAENLGEVLVLRGRHDLVPAAMATTASRRVAS